MAYGYKTPGSGRKKGSINKRTQERRKAIAEIKASGANPLAFFADVLKNEDAPLDLRFRAAEALSPYVHPKLSSVEQRVGGMTHEERLDKLKELMREDPPKSPAKLTKAYKP